MSLKRRPESQAVSLLEIMIVIIILFILSSMGFVLIQVTSSMSYQARCASNLRNIWGLVRFYRQDYGVYPAHYPTPSFLNCFEAYQPDPGMFACNAYDGTDATIRSDSYAPFYVQPRDEMPETVFCLSPFHQEYTRTVAITSRGRVEGAESMTLYYSGALVEPLQQFLSNVLLIGEQSQGRVIMGSNVRLQLVAAYQSKSGDVIVLRVVSLSQGPLEVQIPPRTTLTLISEAGIARMTSGRISGRYGILYYLDGIVYYGLVKRLAGNATVYGTNMTLQ